MNTLSSSNQPASEILAVRSALKELQAKVSRLYGKKAPLILIYGSYARGQSHSGSDVDVLLLFSHPIHPAEEIHRLSAVLADLNLNYQVLISVLPAPLKQYQTSQESFWRNVRREGVPSDRI